MANFLGKKISLISKAGIRYEGILYTIDQVAFTVALSKVKSFGTEDRSTDRYIAARDEVYEYIIFRGSDISDLHVCENSLYTDDSAIVKIMSPNVTNPSSPPAAAAVLSSSHLHGVSIDPNVSDTKPHHQEPLSPPFQPPINISKRFMDFSKTNTRSDDHRFDNNQQQYNQRRNQSDQSYFDKYDPEDLEEIAVQDYRQFKNREQMAPKSDFYDNFSDDRRHFSNYRRPTPRYRGFRNSDSNRGSMYSRGFSGGGGGRPIRNNKDVSLDLIKDDFDFESSNALMVEELANMNVGGHDTGREPINGDEEDKADDCDSGGGGDDDKAFYDKSKSFFDNISSEVSDRSSGISDRRHRNNIETFGASEQYGRGGRGGYRGANRWNGSRGAFRGENYNRGSSVGFLRRGSNNRRGEQMRPGRGQFSQSNQRRPMAPVGSVFSEN